MERKVALSPLIQLRLTASHDRALQSNEEQELLMSNMDLYEEWKRKTEAEGAVVALASAIVEVFAARGLEVSPAQHARIVACTDSSVLLRWIKRAATATSVEEVLAPLS